MECSMDGSTRKLSISSIEPIEPIEPIDESCSREAPPNKRFKTDSSNDIGPELASTVSAAASDGDSDVEFLFTTPGEKTAESQCNGLGECEVVQTVSLDHNSTETTTDELSRKASCDHDDGTARYALAASAYVQNLSEICYTVMKDLRWRTSDGHPLFRWEYGDDLSVIVNLTRFFHAREEDSCCFVCREETNMSTAETRSQLDDNSDTENEGRAVHLYCRLYYRKGPWFRLDDMYNKYYAPAQPKHSLGTSSNPKSNDDESKENQVQPRRARSGGSNRPSSQIDETLLDKHKKCISQLVKDISHLLSMGHLRGFRNEEECGKSVGRSILKAPERDFVLSRLGAKNKRKGHRANRPSQNEIWNQMQKQTSLFSHYGTSDRNSSYLPVRKHVDEVIVQQLARLIIESCSRGEYLTSSVMTSHCESISKFIRDEIASGNSPSCLRLREPPLKALRRLVRLYLCASGGPGSMRGDGSNGWRSVLDLDLQESPPLARLIAPNTAASWHQIDYPGLMVRFGRSSAPFSRSYVSASADQVCAMHVCSGKYDDLRIFNAYGDFQAWECVVELRAAVDYLGELNEILRYNQRRRDKAGGDASMPAEEKGSVDHLGLSLLHVRRRMLRKFLTAFGASHMVRDIESAVEAEVNEFSAGERNKCEFVLQIVGVMTSRILLARNRTGTTGHHGRPWLRHLAWDACMAYILWDVFPIFERNHHYRLAFTSVQILVFGSEHFDSEGNPSLTWSKSGTRWLSRRAVGKAMDRLVIDFTHMVRGVASESEKGKKEIRNFISVSVSAFCSDVIKHSSATSFISFGSMRVLARRLNRPLINVLSGNPYAEAVELGLRVASERRKLNVKTKYQDWEPITDRSIANAIESGDTRVPGRCSFVGYEDDGNPSNSFSSLNVEQLAIECYRTGRLPESQSSISGGGWHGWHDEGGHIRALFRILSATHVLGMDYSNELRPSEDHEFRKQNYTVFLSPYQEAPFDLHVGHEAENKSKSFYSRRRNVISVFLDQLENATTQQVADMVYDAVLMRVNWATMSKGYKDISLVKDIVSLRTLSAIAAGCGGKQLAAAFRCMFFDYRHWSGGLPDLLLFRAAYCTEDRSMEIVDLGDWIGEEFSAEYQARISDLLGTEILRDRDDEYLGCSKVGDSGGQTARSNRRSTGRMSFADAMAMLSTPLKEMMPERLLFLHQDRAVRVQTVFVEVKSANDRLDSRQEDWLNVLDAYGQARVCKFEKSTSQPKKKS